MLLFPCSPAPSAPATGTPLATPLPSGQGLMQRTAGAQVSASRLSREGPDADVELGFLDEDQASPSMLGKRAFDVMLCSWRGHSAQSRVGCSSIYFGLCGAQLLHAFILTPLHSLLAV